MKEELLLKKLQKIRHFYTTVSLKIIRRKFKDKRGC
jgi:hypothetical protein